MNRRYVTLLPILLAVSAPTFAGQEMLENGSFSQQMQGWWGIGGQVSVANKELCIDISDPGSSPWNAIVGQGGLGLMVGEKYTLSFEARSNTSTQFKTLVQHRGSPFTNYFRTDTHVSSTKKKFYYDFVQAKPSDSNVEFQFQVGGQQVGEICVSNVSLKGTPFLTGTDIASIRSNQLGFLPSADKFVYVASPSNEPLEWTLENYEGITVTQGQTHVFGLNRASGENLHHIDLTNEITTQKGLKIIVGGQEGYPFDVNSALYRELKYDALSYFYHNRSGIDIEPEFVQRSSLARPAGHKPDVATCFDKKDNWGNNWPGCDFYIDATGGWYDAGDHGKYMTNSGISTWTLLNLYERGKWVEGAKVPFTEGNALLPEAKSGLSALLPEARWNIEFMLAMQIPSGKRLSAPLGDQTNSRQLALTEIDASHLAFHKIADESWTGVPTAPHEDTKTRYVTHPTTSATLNLAAVAAQCARVWRDIDAAFSQRCEQAAVRAWGAATEHPDIFGYDNFSGSGAYGDRNLSDEFYWAASELYVTTGEPQYRAFIESSPHFLETPLSNNMRGDMYWQYTAPLGTLSLAVVPSELDAHSVDAAKNAIITTAQAYVYQVNNEGYRIPYSVEEYSWGSNSNILNRAMFLVYAHDFTQDLKFIKTAVSGMDYILGANPLNFSYVTGYGSNYARNPHHRFWAHSSNSRYPAPPPGAIVSGPNSMSFGDYIAKQMEGNCIRQTCYKDKSGAWSFNEVAINWNAPLVWVTSALDEGKLN